MACWWSLEQLTPVMTDYQPMTLDLDDNDDSDYDEGEDWLTINRRLWLLLTPKASSQPIQRWSIQSKLRRLLWRWLKKPWLWSQGPLITFFHTGVRRLPRRSFLSHHFLSHHFLSHHFLITFFHAGVRRLPRRSFRSWTRRRTSRCTAWICTPSLARMAQSIGAV